ncbi:MAG: CD225/dispanin family protein [Candidatus Sumerlaeia bacterium]
MLCPKCNAPNPDGDPRCFNCNAPLPRPTSHMQAEARHAQNPNFGPTRRHNVPSHLVGAILVTICCNPIFGIIAIIFAAQVNKHLAIGDFEAAQRASNNAQIFIIIGVILGLCCGGGGLLSVSFNA